jgi:(2Fe-2S) ferredoxin|tara:strand:+ start:819 stop:1148 length:330 start_codon:yes stop_codon:yes gene_type:complete
MKFEKHIFICTNERDENSARKSCGACGGLDLRKDIVRMINEAGLKGKVRANKSGCLDVCEQGPAMVIYPSGYWYLGINRKNIHTIFNKSILQDEPVKELIASKDQLIPK